MQMKYGERRIEKSDNGSWLCFDNGAYLKSAFMDEAVHWLYGGQPYEFIATRGPSSYTGKILNKQTKSLICSVTVHYDENIPEDKNKAWAKVQQLKQRYGIEG